RNRSSSTKQVKGENNRLVTALSSPITPVMGLGPHLSPDEEGQDDQHQHHFTPILTDMAQMSFTYLLKSIRACSFTLGLREKHKAIASAITPYLFSVSCLCYNDRK
ncbi:hypothetical protein AMTR_s00089p00090630, partial [Amborella trichopoda]